jgi:hypothetical protein
VLQVSEKFPFISCYRAFGIPTTVDVASLVKCQLVVASFDGNLFFYSRLPAFARREVHDNNVYLLQAACGKSQDVTGLQLPGVLDDMFAYTGQLGAVFGAAEDISLYLWAPTAQV